MGVKCREVVAWLEELAPPFLAQEGDLVGLLVGDPEEEVEKLLVTLEVTPEVVAEARATGAKLLVSHHPPERKPPFPLRADLFPGDLFYELARFGIGLFVAHTNLDAAPGGVGDVLVRRLGLREVAVLCVTYEERLFKVVVFVPRGFEEKVREAMCAAGAGFLGKYRDCTFQAPGTGTFRPLPGASPFLGRIGELERVEEVRLETVVPEQKLGAVLRALAEAHPYEEVAYDVYPLRNPGVKYGLGRVGMLAEPRPLGVFAEGVRELLGVREVRVAGDLERAVARVAVCPGSGMGLLEQAVAAGAEVYLTGDVRHHEALEALRRGLSIIDAGHHATERLIVPVVADYLRRRAEAAGKSLVVTTSRVDTNPFKIL